MRPIEYRHIRLAGGTLTLCRLEETGNSVTVGAAWSSPSEQWDRKLGNRIARGRAERARVRQDGHRFWVRINRLEPNWAWLACNLLAAEKDLPGWARRKLRLLQVAMSPAEADSVSF